MRPEKLPLRPNVCMLVFNQDKKIFLGERLNEPGVWQLPQGGVEIRYTLEENVLRELEEEIGVSPKLLRIVKQLQATHQYDWKTVPDYAVGKWRGQDQTFWLVEFTGKDTDIDLNRHKPEFCAWKWCTLGEITSIAEPRRVPGYREALQEVEDLFKANTKF